MSESTVDRHVYMFLNRMVYTTYNLTNLEAIKIEYISSQGTLISKILKFKNSNLTPKILQRTSEITLTMVTKI